MVNLIAKTNTFSRQQGVVLIVSLVFLVALTALAGVLMQNTTSDMKMSGASEDKVVATQEAISASDEVMFRQINGGLGNNAFALPLVKFPVEVTETLTKTNTDSDTTADIQMANNDLELEPYCPHSRSASSTQVFSCNVLRVQVVRAYGRKNTNTVVVNTGVVQQLLR